jgi:hypothetical protein
MKSSKEIRNFPLFTRVFLRQGTEDNSSRNNEFLSKNAFIKELFTFLTVLCAKVLL